MLDYKTQLNSKVIAIKLLMVFILVAEHTLYNLKYKRFMMKGTDVKQFKNNMKNKVTWL